MLNPFEALIGRQLARFQQGIEQAVSELAEAVVEGQAAGGRVLARVSGLGELLEVRFPDELVAECSADDLAKLIAEAVNEALAQAHDLKRAKITEYTPIGAMGIEMPDII